MRTAGYARQGLVPTPKESVEYFIDGQDEPETVIGHGLTKTIADTRPPVRGVERIALPPSCFNAEMAARDLVHEYLALAASGQSDELTAMVAVLLPEWMRRPRFAVAAYRAATDYQSPDTQGSP